jgi:hypothetical protein
VRALGEDGHGGATYVLSGPEAPAQIGQVRAIGGFATLSLAGKLVASAAILALAFVRWAARRLQSLPSISGAHVEAVHRSFGAMLDHELDRVGGRRDGVFHGRIHS